jgi:hypothetical protein
MPTTLAGVWLAGAPDRQEPAMTVAPSIDPARYPDTWEGPQILRPFRFGARALR